jgi:deoxyadenosine/deoxycytidine kinase
LQQAVASAQYIAVEGPPGVGKRALARVLAERMGGQLALESKENPFLTAFYQDRRRGAFQAQLFFLLARWQKQAELAQGELFARGGVVSDCLFARDRIYAQLNLSPEEYTLYEKVFGLLGPRALRPDLVVYLQARPEALLQRLRRRHDENERYLTLDYMAEVAKSYSEFFFHWGESPLLVVDTSEVDLADDSKALEDLLAVIGKHRGGVQHYIPLGSRRQ